MSLHYLYTMLLHYTLCSPAVKQAKLRRGDHWSSALKQAELRRGELCSPAVKQTKLLSRFFFDTTGAKKKLTKRNAVWRISRSAERDKGFAPLTAPSF